MRILISMALVMTAVSCKPLTSGNPLKGPPVMGVVSPTSPTYADRHAAERFHEDRVRGVAGMDLREDF